MNVIQMNQCSPLHKIPELSFKGVIIVLKTNVQLGYKLVLQLSTWGFLSYRIVAHSRTPSPSRELILALHTLTK